MDNEQIEAMFRPRGLLDWWDTLLQAYVDMGFTDTLTDEQRLSEFTEIVRKFNSMTAKVKTVFCNNWDFDKEKALDAFGYEDKTKLDSRQALVYAKLRDTWLTISRTSVMYQIDKLKINETDWSNDDRDTIQF